MNPEETFDGGVPAASSESQFKCSECEATFDNKTSLVNHSRNHKSFSCSKPGCEYVTKRKDHLKAHVVSKHPGKEYVTEKPRKRKSDGTSVVGQSKDGESSPVTSADQMMANIRSLLSSPEDVATSSKMPKTEVESLSVAFPADDSDLSTDPLVTHFLQQSLASEPSKYSSSPGHACSNPLSYTHMFGNVPGAHYSAPRARPISLAAHDGFSALKPQELDFSTRLQELNKENLNVAGQVIQPRKSVGKLLEDIKTLDNQINLMCDMRTRLMQELSSKVSSDDAY
ncbi:hypothetical protein AAVH_25662 [Aphelenchoides avenae]|nr:hypothetical protein AAVH_25662 [Aphelenchus avenae]